MTQRPTQLLDWLQRAANHNSGRIMNPAEMRELLAYVAELERPGAKTIGELRVTIGVDYADFRGKTAWAERKGQDPKPTPRYTVRPWPISSVGMWIVYDNQRGEPASVGMNRQEANDHVTYLNASDALAKANAADDKRERHAAANDNGYRPQ